MPATGLEFGPYRLDAHAKRLLRDGMPVDLSRRQFDVLQALAANAGKVLSKDALIALAWGDVSVGDNSLERLISDLRGVLDAGDRRNYIRNITGKGYQFVATTTASEAADSTVDVQALLAPYRSWIEGRAALETLARDDIARARDTFEQLLIHHPREALFHVGLATAGALQFESTRADADPDVDALKAAVAHAHQACRLSPESAEASATLGFVLERTGDRASAIAALQRAAMIEPDNWLHAFRLAAASWGGVRLRGARRTLALGVQLPMAHWLAATVWVARDRLDQAERELDAGLAALEAGAITPTRFSPVALHYLKGLLCLAGGRADVAMGAFERELALEPRGHLYARECCAHTWYAKGACLLRGGDRHAARVAFNQALARVPSHAMAQAGLAIIDGRDAALSPSARTADAAGLAFDRVLARAAWHVHNGDHPGAAHLVAEALAASPPGNTGWLLPIEPLLGIDRARDVWSTVLHRLADRAV